MNLTIIHGPNLNLIGKREPEIYGNQSFEDLWATIKEMFPQIQLEVFQSNHEGELIDKIQGMEARADAFILNAGGLTHTSVSLGDAVAATGIPFVEVHLSNIFSREGFRHSSFSAPYALAVISGMGMEGYLAAIRFLINRKKET